MRAGQIGSYDKNRAIVEKLRLFTNFRSIYFQDIDIEFLKRYEIHCQEKLFNKINTIHMNMKFIRKLFNDAYAQDLIQHKDIPFNKYKLKTEKTHREYLTEEELEKFEKAEVTPGTRMDLHKDMFVFAAYAGGLRVSDVLQLTWDNYDGENIHVSVRKTKAQLSFMLPDRAKEIVAKYRPAEPKPTDFIFPMLPADLKRDDPYELDTEISRATAYINKNLGLIATKVGLTKHISFHISRHTWATRALTKGISIDKVSKILGHADISETQIYAKIINEELNKAMQVFNIKKPEPKPKVVKVKTEPKSKAVKAKPKTKSKAAVAKTKRQLPAPNSN
jgi:integrase